MELEFTHLVELLCDPYMEHLSEDDNLDILDTEHPFRTFFFDLGAVKRVVHAEKLFISRNLIHELAHLFREIRPDQNMSVYSSS